jgi:hypothetical protein
VNAGSDLTASHIIQSALVIGGTAKNPGLVTIDASDADGNPLASPLLATPLPSPSGPIVAGADFTDPIVSIDGGGDSIFVSRVGPYATSAPLLAAVPEPSALLLTLAAIGGGVGVASRRGHLLVSRSRASSVRRRTTSANSLTVTAGRE